MSYRPALVVNYKKGKVDLLPIDEKRFIRSYMKFDRSWTIIAWEAFIVRHPTEIKATANSTIPINTT